MNPLRRQPFPRTGILIAVVIIIFSFLVLLTPLGAAAKPKMLIDLTYTGPGVPAQKLDLYLAQNGNNPTPVVLFIHGGGFMIGDKQLSGVTQPWGNVSSVAQKLTSRGISLVSINYGLAPQSTWPAPLFDVKAAVRWMRANARRFHFDPNRIVAWGDSAGGYFASFLGTTGDDPRFEGAAGNKGYSTKVRAVVNWFGPTDFSALQRQPMALIAQTADGPISQYLACLPTHCFQQARDSSPITHVTRDDAPTLLQYGRRDQIVPYSQGVQLAKKLKRKGVSVEFHGYDCDHEFVGAENIKEILTVFYRFIGRHVR